MLLPFKKKNASEAPMPPIAQKIDAAALFSTPVSEFIPYYCHYSPQTILTKNGELMQIIKIAVNTKGLNYESGTDQHSIVREMIREAVKTNVDSDNYALWLHTIRKRSSIRYKGKYREALAGKVHDRWQQVHKWKYQYYNEIYITVLHAGQSAALKDTSHLKDLILPYRNRNYRNRFLEKSEKELDKVVQGLIATIGQSFVAERLTVVERVPETDDVNLGKPLFYSEPMEFLGTLLNLRAEPMLLPQLDVSDALSTTKQTFGFNAMETKSDSGKRRFGAILSLKQYREVPSETIDRLLQAPMEFVVTQAFNFIPQQGALVQYREQRELFEISGDLYCIEASGIADMMSSLADKETDFGEHQTTVMVLSDELKHLDGEVVKVQTAFADLGLITIREDIKLEECFWSQLPANFEFLRRKDTINTRRVGGFCRLNRYPQGTHVGNHWGDAVTILTTLVGSPYFFNFHHQDNGHTLMLDFNSFNDQSAPILLNFLLCQTRKFDGRLFVFDRHRSADLMFEKLEGAYHYFPNLQRDPDRPQIRLNPFLLEDSPRNRGFLLAWVGTMIAPDTALPDEQKELLRAAIAQMYEDPMERRTLRRMVELVADKDLQLAKAFNRWHSEGDLAAIFDTLEETVDVKAPLNAFDMQPLMRKPETVLPVFAYLLHRIVTSIDGRPTIIMLHEAFDLLDNPFVAPRLESLMAMMQENNAMMIFHTSKPLKAMETEIYETIFKGCGAYLYLPDDVAHDYTQMPTGLNEYDGRRLVKMDRQKGDFMLRQNNETIALRAELKELDELYSIFANDRKNLAAALGGGTEGGLG